MCGRQPNQTAKLPYSKGQSLKPKINIQLETGLLNQWTDAGNLHNLVALSNEAVLLFECRDWVHQKGLHAIRFSSVGAYPVSSIKVHFPPVCIDE